ncbi:MAG: hypothetical protein ACR2PT_06845 [Endozoicomonas sp.]
MLCQNVLVFVRLAFSVVALNLPLVTAANDTFSDPFTLLEKHFEQRAPAWWPQYQVIQASIQKQELEAAQPVLESLLNEQSENELAFELLAMRYLWLAQHLGFQPLDCGVFEVLSETPEPWQAGIQRFCRFLVERKTVNDSDANASILFSWVQWLFEVKPRQTLLAEQALADLEVLQARQPDSLILVGLVSVLMLFNNRPYWRTHQFWQNWQEQHPDDTARIYQLLSYELARQWLPVALPQASSRSFLGLPGAEAQYEPPVRIQDGASHTPVDSGAAQLLRHHWDNMNAQRRRSAGGRSAGAGSAGSNTAIMAETFFGGELFPDAASRTWFNQLSHEQQYTIKRMLFQDREAGNAFAQYRFDASGRLLKKLTDKELDIERQEQEAARQAGATRPSAKPGPAGTIAAGLSKRNTVANHTRTH